MLLTLEGEDTQRGIPMSPRNNDTHSAPAPSFSCIVLMGLCAQCKIEVRDARSGSPVGESGRGTDRGVAFHMLTNVGSV